MSIRVVLTLKSADETLGHPRLLVSRGINMLDEVLVALMSLDENLVCDHSNKSNSEAVLSCGSV